MLYTFLFSSWSAAPCYFWIHFVWCLLCRLDIVSLFLQFCPPQVCITFLTMGELPRAVGSLLPSPCLTPYHPTPLLPCAASPLCFWRPQLSHRACISLHYIPVLVVNIAFYVKYLLVSVIYIKLWLYHIKVNRSKTNEPQTPGQLEKLLSQLTQAKQSCRQVKKSSDRASATSLRAFRLSAKLTAWCWEWQYRVTGLHRLQLLDVHLPPPNTGVLAPRVFHLCYRRQIWGCRPAADGRGTGSWELEEGGWSMAGEQEIPEAGVLAAL